VSCPSPRNIAPPPCLPPGIEDSLKEDARLFGCGRLFDDGRLLDEGWLLEEGGLLKGFLAEGKLLKGGLLKGENELLKGKELLENC
jgi:hypothetical protein